MPSSEQLAGRLWKRVWRVTARRAIPFEPSGFATSNLFFSVEPTNALEIDKLRVQFEIEKALDKEPNTSDITITNCAPGTRAILTQTPLTIELLAGHEEDAGVRHLFTGDLRVGYSKQKGSDWETVLQIGDGSRAFAGARVNRSYARGTPVIVAIRQAAASMGLQLPREVDTSAELNRQFAAGTQLYGSAAQELSRLLAPFGYTWSIQDGRLQILKDDEVRVDRALLISKETGLIGSPEYGTATKAQNKKGEPPDLKFRTLLYPQITPGGKLRVQSRGINGTFRAERVRHVGDTHGDEWFTEVECKPA